jgi:hypothetical protein
LAEQIPTAPRSAALQMMVRRPMRFTFFMGQQLRRSRVPRRGFVFLVDTAHHDLERIIRQESLQRLRLVPGRAHPHIALLLGRQDHWHRLRVDRLDHRVWCRGQEAIDEMRPRDRLRLGATVAFVLGPDAREREQGPVLV